MTAKRRACRTGKTQFRSADHAKEALKGIRVHGEHRDKTPQRAYLCPFCHRWHLSSRDEIPVGA